MMNFALGVIAGSVRKVGATSGGGAFVSDANSYLLFFANRLARLIRALQTVFYKKYHADFRDTFRTASFEKFSTA